MKTFGLIFFSFLFTAATAQKRQPPHTGSIPDPAGYVNDFAHILSVKENQLLEEKLAAFEKTTSYEIAVVTVSSTGSSSIEQYAAKLFDKWGIGKKLNNNGVLLIVAYKDRKMRIATGKGVENLLTDTSCKAIIDEVLAPNFKTNDFYEGIDKAIDRMQGYLQGTQDLDNNEDETGTAAVPAASYRYDASPPAKESNGGFWTTLILVLAGIIFYVVRFFTQQGFWVSPSSCSYDEYHHHRDYYEHHRNDNSISNYTGYSSIESAASSGNESSSAGFGGGTPGGGGASGSW